MNSHINCTDIQTHKNKQAKTEECDTCNFSLVPFASHLVILSGEMEEAPRGKPADHLF
jgi:hypothetical protein